MKNTCNKWLVFGVGVLFLQACSSPHTRHQLSSKKSSSAPHGAQKERSDFQEIQSLSTQNLFEAAEGKITLFERRHPKSEFLPSVENLYGLLLLRQKKSISALAHFRRAIQINPENQPFNQYVLYNLATAQYELLQLDDAQQSLSNIHLNTLDKSNRLKVHFLRGSIYHKKGLPLEASRQLLAAGYLLSNVEAPDNKKAFYKLLDESLQAIPDISSLETLYQEFEDSPVADSLLFRLGSQEVAVGNRGNSEIHLKSLTEKYPGSIYSIQANELLAHSQNPVSLESRSVGILLPMKGKFSKFGTKSLQGIQLAFGIFDPNEPDSKLSLVIEDSGEEVDQSIQALNRLVLNHHVIAVIGPMLSKGVDQISQRAQELGVPLISLSRRAGPTQDYVFQAGLTQQLQAYEIARYAIQKLGAKKFALISPNEKYGLEMGQNFWDAVESMGGKVVGSESYNPGETDFRQVIDKLSGLYYTEARQREINLLAQEREANHITKKTRKTEQFFQLIPLVDYDAVFIPDEPKGAGQILPTFAYRDVDHVKFLGTSSWDSPDFISRGQAYAEQATFVDAYFSESKSPTVRNFTERFKSTFAQDPTSFEALAYDAGSLLRFILTSSSENLSRSELRDKLKKVQNYQGVTGKMTFKNGQFFRDLQALTVRSGKVVEAFPTHD